MFRRNPATHIRPGAPVCLYSSGQLRTEKNMSNAVRDTARSEPVLDVKNLVVNFPLRGGAVVQAVSGVTFELNDSETLGILGESGCGKSSAGRAIMQLPPPTSGSVKLKGKELTKYSTRELRTHRAGMQMMLQTPDTSHNPSR